MRNRIHGGVATMSGLALAVSLTACHGGGGGGGGEGDPNQPMGGTGGNDSLDAGTANAGSGSSGNAATAGGSGGNGGNAGNEGTAATGGMMPSIMRTDGGTSMVPIDMVPPNMPIPMPTADAGALGAEHSPCARLSFPCAEPLVCHAETSLSPGVCARACTTEDECSADEVCGTYNGGLDGVCTTFVGRWEFFSMPDLTICEDDLFAIPLNDFPPFGVCAPPCELPDAAPPAGSEGFLTTCSDPEACIDYFGLLFQDGGRLGTCGVPVARGEACNEFMGLFCEALTTDICAPIDAADLESELRCHQYCDSATPCDEGTCTPLIVDGAELFSYCL